ncbi:MAG: hypothetical protein WCH46_11505, partial [bacterium]
IESQAEANAIWNRRAEIAERDELKKTTGYQWYSEALERAEAAEQQRDKAMAALKTIEGHHNENDSWRDIAREALKECGK